MRHACAHSPRFADRCPKLSEVKHCPEYATQSAPCTNTSNGTEPFLRTRAISSTDISRASTARSRSKNPSTKAIPSGEVIVIWVEACNSISGAISCTNLAAPKSCTMTASTPARAITSICSTAPSSSDGKTSVLKATNPFTPYRWRNSINFGRSSSVKLSARIRALNFGSPK